MQVSFSHKLLSPILTSSFVHSLSCSVLLTLNWPQLEKVQVSQRYCERVSFERVHPMTHEYGTPMVMDLIYCLRSLIAIMRHAYEVRDWTQGN